MKKIIAVMLFGFLCSGSAVPSEKNSRMNILVYPFEVNVKDKYSWIAAGLTDTVISDLSGIRDIYVFSESDRRKALQEISLGMTGIIKESDIVRIGRVMGATMIFTGSVQTAGTKVRVNAKLINIETTRVEKSVKLDGSVDAIFDLQDKVVVSLMNESGNSELNAGINKNGVSEENKPSPDAYELYSKGLEINETDPKRALEFYLKALAVYPDYTDALIKAGSVYDDLKQFDDAVVFLEKAEDLLKKRGYENTAEYAETLNNIGVVYRDLGDYEKALEYYSKSLKIRENLKLADTVNYAETLSNIGIVYVDTGKYDKALEYYLESHKILNGIKFHNSSKYAVLMNNIGGVYWSTGNYDMALKFYLHSREIRDKLELQNTIGYAYLMNNIGGVYWKKGDSSNALHYYMKSREIRDRIGMQNTESYSTLMSNIALTYYKQLNDPCKGKEYMKICVEIDRKNNFLRLSSDLKDLNTMEEACSNK